ncbi:PTS sugar transporter subunit IIA [candidate division KSB1 bacterium]|nr:PTS sugar transporter subunit IIA [candidate division KSB1 bacterium]
MRLHDLLSPEVIRIPLEHTDKQEIIAELIDILSAADRILDKKMALEAVLERERIMSTGIGEGVAIPHAKTLAVDKLVAAFGITKESVDFQAIDEKPVRLVFMLVGPMDPTGPHLQALSRISRLMHRSELREKLITSRTSQEVLQALAQEEQKYL